MPAEYGSQPIGPSCIRHEDGSKLLYPRSGFRKLPGHGARRKRFTMRSFLHAAFGFVLLFPSLSIAQFEQGQIAGTVKDSSQAVVVGARVTAIDRRSGLQSNTTTGSNGAYVIPNLPAGQYEVTVQAQGFKRLSDTSVRVDAATRTTLDVSLEVGQVTETVSVSATAALIDSETAQVGRTVESKQITDLALNGRNPIKLAVLKAGVIG